MGTQEVGTWVGLTVVVCLDSSLLPVAAGTGMEIGAQALEGVRGCGLALMEGLWCFLGLEDCGALTKCGVRPLLVVI